MAPPAEGLDCWATQPLVARSILQGFHWRGVTIR